MSPVVTFEQLVSHLETHSCAELCRIRDREYKLGKAILLDNSWKSLLGPEDDSVSGQVMRMLDSGKDVTRRLITLSLVFPFETLACLLHTMFDNPTRRAAVRENLLSLGNLVYYKEAGAVTSMLSEKLVARSATMEPRDLVEVLTLLLEPDGEDDVVGCSSSLVDPAELIRLLVLPFILIRHCCAPSVALRCAKALRRPGLWRAKLHSAARQPVAETVVALLSSSATILIARESWSRASWDLWLESFDTLSAVCDQTEALESEYLLVEQKRWPVFLQCRSGGYNVDSNALEGPLTVSLASHWIDLACGRKCPAATPPLTPATRATWLFAVSSKLAILSAKEFESLYLCLLPQLTNSPGQQPSLLGPLLISFRAFALLASIGDDLVCGPYVVDLKHCAGCVTSAGLLASNEISEMMDIEARTESLVRALEATSEVIRRLSMDTKVSIRVLDDFFVFVLELCRQIRTLPPSPILRGACPGICKGLPDRLASIISLSCAK